LAKFKFLRATPFDPFGYSAERKLERALVRDYEAMLEEVLARLSGDNHPIAVGLAAIPEKIRGFGHVKLRHLKAAKADEAGVLEQLRAGGAPLLKAGEKAPGAEPRPCPRAPAPPPTGPRAVRLAPGVTLTPRTPPFLS